MANALFDAYKELCITTGLNLSSVDIKAVIIDHADDTPVPGTDDFYDDIAAAARVAETGNLGSKTTTDGTFDAADAVFSSASGDECESVIFYEDDAGGDAASTLIAFFDTGVTGLPVTPNGADINLNFNASGIFSL